MTESSRRDLFLRHVPAALALTSALRSAAAADAAAAEDVKKDAKKKPASKPTTAAPVKTVKTGGSRRIPIGAAR